jgi:hypothetical protein
MDDATGIVLDGTWTMISDSVLVADGRADYVFVHENGCRLIAWRCGALDNANNAQEDTLPWTLPTGFEDAFSQDGADVAVAYASDTQTFSEWYGEARVRSLVKSTEVRVGTAILFTGETNFLLCTADFTSASEGYDYDLRFEEAMLPVIQNGISIL